MDDTYWMLIRNQYFYRNYFIHFIEIISLSQQFMDQVLLLLS